MIVHLAYPIRDGARLISEVRVRIPPTAAIQARPRNAPVALANLSLMVGLPMRLVGGIDFHDLEAIQAAYESLSANAASSVEYGDDFLTDEDGNALEDDAGAPIDTTA